MKTLLLSNINMKPLVALMRPMEIVCGEFDSILTDLVNPQSAAASGEYDRILCLYDGDSLMGEALYGEPAPDRCDALIAALDGFCTRHPEKIVVTHTFCLGSARWLTYADLAHPQSLKARETVLNQRLVALAHRNPNMLLFDLEAIVRRHGEVSLFTAAFWYAGRIRYTSLMFRELGAAVRQALDAYGNKAKKVLVLDLDNTLWGGIVGETGAHDIVLSEDGAGRCYRDFQRALKALARTGVLLAICSKNNPGDVDEVFERNPMMILRREDFAAIRVDWQPKPENIADIARSLDLGLDSFVFIDDNPVERSLMAGMVPEVTVPAFPAKPEELPGWFRHTVVPRHFGKYVISEEDGNKTAQYRANEVRHGLAARLDLDTFLAELGIECTLHVDSPDHIARAAQMTQKTNQFNLTTRRYQIPDIRRFVESNDHSVILLDYKDRFGSEGAVGLAIVDLLDGRLDTFLMSCRVIGRRVEDRLLDKAADVLRARGQEKMVGELVPTRRNGLVSSFYEDHGFRPVSSGADGRKLYERSLQ